MPGGEPFAVSKPDTDAFAESVTYADSLTDTYIYGWPVAYADADADNSDADAFAESVSYAESESESVAAAACGARLQR